MNRENEQAQGSELSDLLGRAIEFRKEIEQGGAWLGAARSWMQNNIQRGDTLCWSSTEIVNIPFYKLEEMALRVALAAVEEDRKRRAT